MNEHGHVFISGLHRSGKSVLAQCLNEHPSISAFFNPDYNGEAGHDESQFIPQPVYESDKAFGGPGAFGYRSEVRMDETHLLATEASGRQLSQAWKPYWDLRSSLLLDTSPPNLLRARFLQAVFPETYFVHVLRHPLAVSYETADKCMEEPRPRMDQLLDHWLICNEQFERDRPHLRNVYTVKYESLVAEPQAVLNDVYEFLGVNSVPNRQEIKPDIDQKYFCRWASTSSRFGEALPLKKILRLYCCFRFERRANAFGYSLKNPPECYEGDPVRE